MNDIDRQDADDRLMDRNLRAAARHLELPETPTPLQRARWKQGATAPASTAPKKGILGMKPSSFWRVIGTGGALAACITAAVILGFGGAKTVKAAAIFDSLREAIRKSLWVEVDGVSQDGMTANGRALLVFDDRDQSENAETANGDGLKASYLEFRVTGADDHPDWPGLDIELAFGKKSDDQWAFVKTHYIPPTAFVRMPMLAMFATTLNGGVFLDLDQFDTDSSQVKIGRSDTGLGPNFSFSIGNSKSIEAPPPDDDEKRVTVTTEYSIGGGNGESNASSVITSDDPETLELIKGHLDEMDADENGAADHVNEHLHGAMFDTDFRVASESPEEQAAIEEHVQMVEDFLTGRFTPEQMDRFIDQIEASAEQTTVTPNADGSYLLRATGFDFAGHPGADDDLALEITYRADTGIDRVELLNLGDGAGVVRFVFSDDDETSEVFERTRYSTREGVRIVDSVRGLLGGSQE